MKKITLALLLVLGLNNLGFGQANIAVQAPPYDGWAGGLNLPSGFPAVVYHRSSYLILKSELTSLALTNSVITTMGIDLQQSSNVATVGQFTVYLENTPDNTYNKGQNFAAAIAAPAQLVYQGNLSFPVNSGAQTISLPLTNNFNYTGDGIYVVCDWFCAAPTATLPVRTLLNSSGLTTPTITGGGCYGSSSVAPAPATMTNTTNFRPCFRFTAANSATNEVSVTYLAGPGKVSKLMGAAHTVTAQIRNNSNIALSNIPVTLSVTGANAYTETRTVTSIGAGSFQTVAFTGFNPTVSGLNSMTATIPSDQLNTNNESLVWQQSVTCNEGASNPPNAAASFTGTNYGFTAATGGILSSRYAPVANVDLQGIRLAVGTGTTIAGKQIFGVLLDATGNIIETTNTITATAAMQGTFVKFDFPSLQPLTAGTNYHLGIGIPVGPMYPLATLDLPYNAPNYYSSALAGGGVTAVSFSGAHAGIEAVLSFSNLEMSASASKTVVCKLNPTTTLTTTGATTYTYTRASGAVSSTAGVAVVTPTITGAQGMVNYTVNGTDAGSGCRMNQAVISISVAVCQGIAANGDYGVNISVYPNPAVNGKAIISGLEGTNTINVINVLGQSVLTLKTDEETVNIDLSKQVSGNYLVKITDETNMSRIVKLVVQN